LESSGIEEREGTTLSKAIGKIHVYKISDQPKEPRGTIGRENDAGLLGGENNLPNITNQSRKVMNRSGAANKTQNWDWNHSGKREGRS